MIINIFSAYAKLLLKDINHRSLLQEWKLSIDAADYGKKIDANLYKHSEKNNCNRHDSNLYCPTSIKDTIQWFTFLAIVEHTPNIIKTNKGIIPSFLNLFAMF